MGKYRFLIYFIFFVCVILYAFAAKSQKENISFQHITPEHGLSQKTAYCIIQDSEGFLWFGTQGGLNKYNGISFEHYKHDLLEVSSISDNWVFSISEDRSGNVWVATNKGFNRLEKRTGKITRYYHDPNNPTSISNNMTFGVYVDNEGYVWVKTAEEINKLDTSTGEFTRFEHYVDYFDPIAGEGTVPIIGDEGGLWVATHWGLNYFDKEYEHFKRYYHNPDDKGSISSNHITSLCVDRNRDLWVGTKNGLNKFNRKTQKFTKYFHNEYNDNSLSDNYIHCIFEDKNGDLWIGTEEGGLNRYNKSDNTFIHYKNESDNPESISRNKVISIYEDRSGNLWIGTFGGGLNKADMKKKKFQLYRSEGENSINLPHKDVASIYLNDDGLLWIGTWGGGLGIYNRETGNIKIHSTESPPGKRIVGDAVFVIFNDSKNRIWIGTNSGISIYDRKSKTFSEVREYFKEADFVSITNRINSIIEDRHHNFWIGTERGLHKFNENTNELITFLAKYKSKERSTSRLALTANKVYSVIEDRDGMIWIGTSDGLNMLDPYENTITNFWSDYNSTNTLSNGFVTEVFESSDGYIWIGTSSGLNKYDKKNKTFSYFTIRDGLPDDQIYEIQEDNNGNLWFSTNKGLAMFNPRDSTTRNYNVSDGLQDWEFNVHASYKSGQGEMFFGGTQGMNSFFPDSLKKNENIPPIVITSIEKTNNYGRFQIYEGGEKNYTLTYRDHTLTIKFAALEYTQPENNQYMYIMEGLMDEWINNGNTNFVTFSNLPPNDEYIFRVRGSNNDRVWNEKGTSIVFSVKPPFWKTIWAYLCYILIAISIIYYVIRVRTQKLRTQNQILREKQLASLEIARQKEILTIKNKSITDSINYAKRIQDAMLPSEFLFKKLLPESFILFKPRDIVSGDFYWIAEKGNKIFVAAVDCTGHGVPGAFMSIIGFDLLRNITKEQGIENPAQILNQLNVGVSETFSKRVDDHKVRDGMDIALCVIDQDKNILEYAGAFNPLYLARDNNIVEIKGNRFSVGRVENVEEQQFENHIVKLIKKDVVYLFTDGYPDQFGGPLGKKFKYRRLRHLLLTIHNLPIQKQKAFLDENIENWKGELEQVDDILIIGIRVN